MELIKIDSKKIKTKDLILVQRFLQKGKVCILPTDTCYIIAVNALNKKAIKKVFDIKHRLLDKPIHVNIPSLKLAEKWVDLLPQAKILADNFLPGPITLVLPKKNIISNLLTGGRKTLGIRIPDHFINLTLGEILSIPYTSTSANLSKGKTSYSIKEVFNQLDKKKVDLVVDVGSLPRRSTSTVVDLTTCPVQVLREGVISSEKILKALGAI